MSPSMAAVAISIAILAVVMVFAPYLWQLLSIQPLSTKTVTRLSTVTVTSFVPTPSPITIERTSFVTLTKPMLITVTERAPVTITERVTKTLPTTVTRTVPTTVFKTVTQRVERIVTSPVVLTSTVTRTVTVTTTSPIIFTSTSYVWATVTVTNTMVLTETRTVTATVTTTKLMPNFRLASWEELHSTLMSDKVKEVYALMLYVYGVVSLDSNFVNLINDLKQLAERNVTIKVLVHPRICTGWKYGPPGIVAPELVKLVNGLNRSLGYEGLRVIRNEDLRGDVDGYLPDLGFNPLTIYSGDAEAEVLVILANGTARLFLLADPYEPKIILFDHVENLEPVLRDMIEDFKHVFDRGLVWNPERVCSP